jgi:hypothetical protein
MILKILGWLWLITGIISLIKPEWLRKRMQKKTIRKLKWVFIGIAWVIGAALIKTAGNFSGIIYWVITIVGIIAIIKGFLFISGKTSDKLMDWFSAQPVSFLRAWAVFAICLGIFFVFIK